MINLFIAPSMQCGRDSVVLILMSNHVLDVFDHQNRQIAHEYGINCDGRNFIIISVGFPLVVKEHRDSHFHINEKSDMTRCGRETLCLDAG